MYNLMIAAYPTSSIRLMVTEGVEAKEIDSVLCFFPQLIVNVRDMLRKYDIQDITVYGPRTYITHVGNHLNNVLKDKNIKLAFAGEEN